ncbi:MAG: alanine racemase [Cyanobacteria bacterium J06600_6]
MLSEQQQRQNLNYHSLPLSANRQRAWVEIDLDALIHNVRTLKAWLNDDSKLMAVVKADAYGHGAVTVAKVALANGADSLAVATLQESVELRRSGIDAPILVLGVINTVEDIQAAYEWGVEPTIIGLEQALIFGSTLKRLGKSLRVHLKLDTGMSRLGTNWQDAVPFVAGVQSQSHLQIASIYSHFATADESDRTVMELQQRRFSRAIASLSAAGLKPPQVHLANSAATLNNRSSHYDLVRVGLALYGLYPAPHLEGILNLKPVLQVKAKITQVKLIPPGEGISYGRQYITDAETKIAVVGIGYADGVPRSLSNQLQAIVNGQKVAQVGAITMDQLMLRIDHRDQVKAGDIVTLIGRQNGQEITADNWADRLKTISWEILCGFKHRLPRIFI